MGWAYTEHLEKTVARQNQRWSKLRKAVEQMEDQSWFDGVNPYSSVLEEMDELEND